MNKSLVGQTFGKLTVIECAGKKKSTGHFIWRCRCECGKYHSVSTSYLKDGRSTSCGCVRRKIMQTQHYSLLGKNAAAFNILYRNYTKGARRRNIGFELSEDEFKILTKGICYYCGKIPSQIGNSTTGSYVYNGIDRVDNLKGYTIDNCVSCCGDCNRIKRSITVSMCRKVIEFIDKEKERV